ncbi:OmpH family outer membrane protein [Mucilaginibacter hurinus]|uniref:OmpH family outer membrane protein n=1 Tax=Mucilaginibacter hurinus TaxID=2201324 RepID=A0A367GSW6_9SPHI|nr:OmpH family outer membrane protein [Mucilaginibacter hurinus]RCH56522.1 OmpH family outer membrane protein [Mucilaginibacter hurinus]
MKKLLKVALVALCVLFAGNYAKAQAKIGHLSFNALIDQMPETKTVKTQLDAYQKQFIDQYTTMTNEFQTKVQGYESKKASMTDATKTATETELQDMQKRLQEFQRDAQGKVEAKSSELSKPLLTKAKTAINQVAKEKGYAYVLDSSQIELLVSPDADDLLAAVKLKLGLK